MKRANTFYSYAQKRLFRGDEARWNRSGVTRILGQLKCHALLGGALLLLLPGFAAAQGNPVRPRITDRVDDARLILLQGNTHPLARAQFDQGAAPPNLPMDRMMLVLKRSPEQETALQDLIEQQQDTSSPNYHKWVTPDQFGQQFGPADQDIQAVTAWLTSRGFQGIQVSKGRTVIEFSGTAAQVESALHTAIHKYVVNAEEHWANANDPQIPAALAPIVSGLVSLHNFPKKPLSVRSARNVIGTVTRDPKPQINFTDGTHGLAPADFNVIYHVGSGMTGAGATIGVVAHSNIHISDVTQFRSAFGLPANDPQVILNGPDPGILTAVGEEDEAVLDATWTGAVAPNATVKLVVTEDTNAAFGIDLSEEYIVDNNAADIMTESFGTCEGTVSAPAPAGEVMFYEFLAEQAAAQGITNLVASGDAGPDGCDDPSSPPAPLTSASVNLIASTPFTVAVGGTQFNESGNDSTYWQATNGTSGLSAKSYIPENVWNESSMNGGLGSSGGGQSIAFATKPSWQSGVAGIPATNARFVPDVSLSAAGHDAYVICIDASCQGGSPSVFTISGTSASAQAFGGIMALVVEKTGARQGQANYVLYKLAASETLSSCNGSSASPPPISTCVFNDTTVGNTNIPGETGFTATTGYDQATGLGSVNVSNLVNQWSTAIVKASTTTLLLNNGVAVNITHGHSVPVNITVAAKAPATGTPTGDVSLISSSVTWQGTDGFTLTSGSVSSNTILLPGGTYTVKAHYAGDGTFIGSDSTPPISVTVSPEASQTDVALIVGTPCIAAASVPYGSPYILSVGVRDSAGSGTVCFPLASGTIPTGTVTLTDNSIALDGGTFNLNSFGYFEDQTIQLPVGTHTIKAVYNGDNSFNSSTNNTGVITVTKAATTTTIAANPTSVAVGGNVTLTATVSTTSNATASAAQEPNGMMQFFLGVVPAPFGAPVAVTGGVNSVTTFAQATASISTTTLPNGTNTITAQYLGDSNYAASAAQSTPVTVSVGLPGINLTPASNTATIPITAPGQSGTQLITVSGANGFAGSVTLACAVTAMPASAVDLPTCNFGAPDQNFTAPSTITLSATATTGNATMTVATTPVHGVVFRPPSHPLGRDWPLAAVAVSLIGFFFVLGIPRQRRWGFAALAVLLVGLTFAGAGCGNLYNSGSGGSNPGTTVGTYTVTVTATPASGTAQTTAIAVNVQ